MIVTIDGPAGAGKSTVAKRLARRLGFGYLDTGAMYRAVALAGQRAGVDWSNDADIVRLTQSADIRWQGDRILLNGEDVSGPVRSNEITAAVGRRRPPPGPPAPGRSTADRGRRRLACHGRARPGIGCLPRCRVKSFSTPPPGGEARRRVEDFAHAVKRSISHQSWQTSTAATRKTGPAPSDRWSNRRTPSR